jgi:hypothetical protein
LFEERAGLTRKCNPESTKGFITKSSGLRDGGENLATLYSFSADSKEIYVFDQLEHVKQQSESHINRKGEKKG